MSNDRVYMIALFKSVHHVLASENILKDEGIPHKLIPVPKSVSTDCGICIRFFREDMHVVERLLLDSNGFLRIIQLN